MDPPASCGSRSCASRRASRTSRRVRKPLAYAAAIVALACALSALAVAVGRPVLGLSLSFVVLALSAITFVGGLVAGRPLYRSNVRLAAKIAALSAVGLVAGCGLLSLVLLLSQGFMW